MNLNTPLDIILFVIEVVGCISFATSGAIVAIRKKADFLGILILTLIEVFGGGLLRDLIIDQGSPHIFWDTEYLILASFSIATALVLFFISYFKKTAPLINRHRHDFWIYFSDALGIAIFCVYGVNVAFKAMNNWTNYADVSIVGKFVYMISLGVITAVGGGMFRDVFIGEIPTVFCKHFYMTPCILGTLIYAILYYNNVNNILSIVIGAGIIVALRTLAIIYKWNLPGAKGYNELTSEEKDELVLFKHK